MTEKLYMEAAFHEGGHIVMAYFVGFTCKYVQLDNTNPGNAWVYTEYGVDTDLVLALIKGDTDPSEFDNLPREVKVNAPPVGKSVCLMLCGGPVAEYLHLRGNRDKGVLVGEISGPDKERVEAVDWVLKHIPGHYHPTAFVDETFQEVGTLLIMNQFWSAIESLADGIIESEDKYLSQEQIESILKETGFIDFLKQNNVDLPAHLS